MDTILVRVLQRAGSLEMFEALIKIGEKDLKKLSDIKILIECILKKYNNRKERKCLN